MVVRVEDRGATPLPPVRTYLVSVCLPRHPAYARARKTSLFLVKSIGSKPVQSESAKNLGLAPF
jgi:hypothetical protein